MRIFVDIDGTLTEKQTCSSAFKVPPRADVVEKVKELIAAGHEVILWSGNAKYAEKVAKLYNIKAFACLGKPQLIIDNQDRKLKRVLKRAVVTPEVFLLMDFNKKEQ
ncbi:MAG: hypothetical protein AABY32_04055 [Nanoarchaeota archaeon]